jgi:hypothetical protein
MLFVTIQDGLALGSISGQAFKGYKGCTWCMDETGGILLKHCKKVVYMDHRRFLWADHPYRKNKKAFDGTIKKCRVPKIYNGEHMFRMVKDLKVVLEKGKGGSKRQRRQERIQRRMRRIMVTKLLNYSKKDQYFGTYHIGRTWWCVMQLMSCMWRRMCAKHWSVPCWIYLAKLKIHLKYGWT